MVTISPKRHGNCAKHPLTDEPWVFSFDELRTAAAAELFERVAQRKAGVAVPSIEQADLRWRERW